MKTTDNHRRHHAALASLHAFPSEVDGASIWRKLRRIELRASRAATAQCNGEAFEGQPYRDETDWEAFQRTIVSNVSRAFGGVLPPGFFFNTDPRGYALKIDPERGTVPEGLAKDWGGYGCLAAEIR